MKKITIIGSGRVGSTIAYSLALRNIASEVVVIDIDEQRALGEALDIRQGMPYDSTCFVYAGNYTDAKGSDIVVITSGIARKPGQSRLELININIEILSLPEGADKPLKYPLMFTVTQAVIVNKVDTRRFFEFDDKAFVERVKSLNPLSEVFFVSAKTGEGFDEWIKWLRKQIAMSK